MTDRPADYVDPAQASAKQAVDQQVALVEAAQRKNDRIKAMLDDFPFRPVGNRVVILPRRPEHVSSGKHGARILLVRDESLMPLTGWIVAVPDPRQRQFVDGVWYFLDSGPGASPPAPARGKDWDWGSSAHVEHPAVIRWLDPTYDGNCPLDIGDLVVFPEHAYAPITVTIDDEEWTFFVMDYRDVLGKVKDGSVDKLSEVVPGLEDQPTIKADDVKAAYPDSPEA